METLDAPRSRRPGLRLLQQLEKRGQRTERCNNTFDEQLFSVAMDHKKSKCQIVLLIFLIYFN